MSNYFNREYEVLINGETVVDAYFRMVFDVTIDVNGFISYADVSIFNLNADTKALIRKKGATLTLRAGYSDNIAAIFSGSIINVFDERFGPDTSIRIIARGGSQPKASIEKSFGAGVRCPALIKACGGALGYPLEINEDHFTAEPPYIGGYTMHGDAKAYMDRLAQTHNFGYAVDREKITVTKLDKANEKTPFVISQQTGMVGIPEISEVGCSVDVKLEPALRIGGRIRIDAGLRTFNFNDVYFQDVPDSAGTGVYSILRMRYTGDTHGDDWTVRVEGLR